MMVVQSQTPNDGTHIVPLPTRTNVRCWGNCRDTFAWEPIACPTVYHPPPRNERERTTIDRFIERSGYCPTDDDKLEEGLRRVARQAAQNEIGKKPEVTVVVSRLS